MIRILRTGLGVMRSVRIYHGNRKRSAAMVAFYSRFAQPGDLVFDIGAHVGDHIATFRRLRARIIAVEPQPALARILKLFYGRDRNVVIEQTAVGRASGTTTLMINIDNPTISTASADFIRAAQGARGWQGEAWTKPITVPVTTIDALIARHGLPSFIKIDVEGFEAEALAGLTQPVPALSFEFTTIQRDVAHASVERCGALGFDRFNAALRDIKTFVHDDWIEQKDIARWLAELSDSANSGDIYAVRSAIGCGRS
jgi:FkbM family methyltransferase